MACVQDGFLSKDVLQEMVLLAEFYKGAPDLVRFQEPWSPEHTYRDKLEVGLGRGGPGAGPGAGRRGGRLPPRPGGPLPGRGRRSARPGLSRRALFQLSLASRTPADQGLGLVLEQVHGILRRGS